MKKKIHKILGIGLAFMLVASLMAFGAPVAAADYEENDWGEWGLPSLDADTDVGPMAVAPDGTIYAAVLDGDWMVQKSEDRGYTWDDTELTGLVAAKEIVDIAVSLNYKKDETVYVGCADGTVYRLEEAGEGDVIALKGIPGVPVVSALYSIDVWFDGDDNWILVGTDIDVFVIKDKRFEDWRDQELNKDAYEVAFAPDFDDSELIWAVTVEAGNFLVTSTVSPGQWGQEVGEAVIPVTATEWVDIGFPDDYDSDPDTGDTLLFVGVSSSGGGDVYLIEGVEGPDEESNAIPLFALAGKDSVDIVSLAVSGDYADAVILAGARSSPTIWRSDDGGDSWDDATKNPTGDEFTYVVMAPGDFDPEDGVAYASTYGDESAVSRSDDGGEVWNQTGLIDTDIDKILDLGFHPDFPSDSIFFMLTQKEGASTYSLWLTENGDEEEPDYVRVLCAAVDVGNFAADSLKLVEFAQDADAIFLHGVDSDSVIWKSTNDGQTFGSKRKVKAGAGINDWEIFDSRTIYAATTAGFAKTINSGLSWTTSTVGSAMNDIALQPGFDPDDADMDNILLGSDSGGEVFVSLNGGDTWKNTGVAESGTAMLDGTVFVAFDADYADEDADGYKLIYAADDSDNAIIVGEEDGVDTEWDDLDDKENEDPVKGDFYGLAVADDNALYAIADTATYAAGDPETFANATGVVRLLLHESNRVWEAEGESGVDNPRGLWITPGSNVLWTINGGELWVLEDTCSGKVTLDSPSDGYRSDELVHMRISWDALPDADEYEYKWTNVAPDVTDSDQVDGTSVLLTDLFSTSEYEWKVRVAWDEPWSSRWSSSWTFHTALGPPPWSPTLYTPGGEWQYSGINVDLMPAFSWQSAQSADSYQFVLADNAELASPLVNKKVSSSAYQLDFELEYNSNYFWKVQAYKGTKAISRWSDIGAFTTLEKAVAPPAPAPPATVTQPAPGPIVIPTPIPPALLWTIIGIGALLIVAVIVLIVRTRRVV